MRGRSAAQKGVFGPFQSLMHVLLVLLQATIAIAAVNITRTVIVMRHCVRTTPFTLDGEIFPDFNDYSSRPFPDWKYPAWQCVPRGLDMIATQGAFLRDEKTLAQPLLKVISDAIDRDVDTSHSLLQGLGMPSFPVITDARALARSHLHESSVTFISGSNFRSCRSRNMPCRSRRLEQQEHFIASCRSAHTTRPPTATELTSSQAWTWHRAFVRRHF
jgi:hypothetical protein